MSPHGGTALVVDSSVFVSALGDTEEHREISRNFLAGLAASGRTVVLPTTVVLETGNVLMRKGSLARSAPLIAAFHARFDAFEVVPIDDEFVSSALLLFPRLALRTADAIVAVTAALHDAVLVSWDTRLLRGARTLVSALTPADFLRQNQARE